MATVNYIREKTQNKTAMKRVIDYVLQNKKTLTEENGRRYKLVSGINCSPDTAFNEFMTTKNQYDKAKGMFFYQYTQSFDINENVSSQTVHQVGCRLAGYFKDHEVLVATHIDADHLHTHFIINSVNHITGKKLQEGPDSLYKLRKLSDSICLEYGLSVLKPYEKSNEKGIGTREYRSALKGDSWKFKLINTVDICIKKSRNKKEFIYNMEQYGYKTLWEDNRKHITYTIPDGKKCRDNKFHDKKYLKTEMEGYFELNRELKRIEQAGRSDYVETLPTHSICNTSGAMGSSSVNSNSTKSASNRDNGLSKNTPDVGGDRDSLHTSLQNDTNQYNRGHDKTPRKYRNFGKGKAELFHSQNIKPVGISFKGLGTGNHRKQSSLAESATGKGLDPSKTFYEMGGDRDGSDHNILGNSNSTDINIPSPKDKKAEQDFDLEL